MRDVRLMKLAEGQFNRVARWQLIELGVTAQRIDRFVSRGWLVGREQGVFAVPPVLEHDEWGRWMEATLTAPETFLSHVSAAAAFGTWGLKRDFEVVTRPGSGGPRRHGGLLVYRSSKLKGETASFNGIPTTTPSRTLLDLARTVSERALARALREMVRLKHTTLHALGDDLGRFHRRRGSRRLAEAVARYSGLPLERARSGAEIRALEVLRDAGRALPRLNFRIAGEEADLSWPSEKRIIEIDGGPFHLDVGEDARKQRRWEEAGWTVLRISDADVYERPNILLGLALGAERPTHPH